MAPRDKDHELMLARQRIQVLELTVQILEKKLELAKMNQRSYPYSYPTVTYGTTTGYTLGTTSG